MRFQLNKGLADILVLVLPFRGRVDMTGEREGDDFTFTLSLTALLLYLGYRLPDYIDAVLEIFV